MTRAYVVQGFIDNYQGYYGSVLPWDLGIVTLKQPIGENLGWLGYNNYDVARRFHRQHRRLSRRQAGRHDVALDLQRARRKHRRRLFPVRLRHLSRGRAAAAVYAYDEGAKARIVVGVNVAESSDFNTAVRINAAYLEWINSLNK